MVGFNWRKAGAHAVDDTWLDKRKWEYGNDSGDGVGGKGADGMGRGFLNWFIFGSSLNPDE